MTTEQADRTARLVLELNVCRRQLAAIRLTLDSDEPPLYRLTAVRILLDHPPAIEEKTR